LKRLLIDELLLEMLSIAVPWVSHEGTKWVFLMLWFWDDFVYENGGGLIRTTVFRRRGIYSP